MNNIVLFSFVSTEILDLILIPSEQIFYQPFSFAIFTQIHIPNEIPLIIIYSIDFIMFVKC